MKVELKVHEGGVVSPARRQKAVLKEGRLFHYPKKEKMSLYYVKVSLKLRADAALTPIYATASIAAEKSFR